MENPGVSALMIVRCGGRQAWRIATRTVFRTIVTSALAKAMT